MSFNKKSCSNDYFFHFNMCTYWSVFILELVFWHKPLQGCSLYHLENTLYISIQSNLFTGEIVYFYFHSGFHIFTLHNLQIKTKCTCDYTTESQKILNHCNAVVTQYFFKLMNYDRGLSKHPHLSRSKALLSTLFCENSSSFQLPVRKARKKPFHIDFNSDTQESIIF